VSNIAAGTPEQIDEVLHAGLVPLLINVLKMVRLDVKQLILFGNCVLTVDLTVVFFQGDFRAQKEAAWAITNITSGGQVSHMVFLCGEGALPVMCAMLGCKDWRTVLVILDGLDNILKVQTHKCCLRLA